MRVALERCSRLCSDIGDISMGKGRREDAEVAWTCSSKIKALSRTGKMGYA
jgi:ribosomal protein L24E